MSTSLSPRSSASVHPTRQQLDELDALLQRMLELPVNASEEAVAEPAARKPERPAREAAQADPRLPKKESVPPRPTAEKLPEPPRPLPPEDEADRLRPRVLPMPARDEAEVADHGRTPEEGDDWVPLRSSWQPSAQTWGPLAKQWQEAQQAGQVRPNADRKTPSAPADEPEEEVPQTQPGTDAVERHEAEPEPERPKRESVSPADEAPAALPTSWQMDAHPAREPVEPLPSLKALLPPLQTPAVAEKPAAAAPAPDEPPLSVWLWPFAAVDAIFDGCLYLLGPFGKPLRTRAGKSFLGVLGLLCLAGAAALAAIDWFNWTW